MRIVPHHQPINHRFDGVVFVPVQLNFLVHGAHFAVDAHPHKAGFAHVVEDALVVPFAVAD